MRSEFGDGSPPRPVAPSYDFNRVMHEPWLNCFICGFTVPVSESVIHYRKGRYVCQGCADNRTQADNLEYVERPLEHGNTSPQKVDD